MLSVYDEIWKAIIRPPRDHYEIEEELGPKCFRIESDRSCKVLRTDMQLTNKRGLKLECSMFEPHHSPLKQKPCVVYLHGNSSSRVEAVQYVDLILPMHVSLFCFDFSGCGKSEGDYISLGYHEKDDVSTVVEYLRSTEKVSLIGLWGRSMGAVSALMHADRDPSIAGLVLDSPFSNIIELAEDLFSRHSNLPGFLFTVGMAIVKKTIRAKANFDLEELNPLGKNVDKAFIPAMFIAAKNDDFVAPYHSKKLFDAYAGDKVWKLIDGTHNSKRPKTVRKEVSDFFYRVLQVSEVDIELSKAFIMKQNSSSRSQRSREVQENNPREVNEGPLKIKEPTALKPEKNNHENSRRPHAPEPQINEDPELEAAIKASLLEYQRVNGKMLVSDEEEKKSEHETNQPKPQNHTRASETLKGKKGLGPLDFQNEEKSLNRQNGEGFLGKDEKVVIKEEKMGGREEGSDIEFDIEN